MARWVRCFLILILSSVTSTVPLFQQSLAETDVWIMASVCISGLTPRVRKTVRKLDFQRKASFLSVRDMALYVLCVILSQCMTPAHRGYWSRVGEVATVAILGRYGVLGRCSLNNVSNH